LASARGQRDVAADAQPAGLAGAAVGGLHDPGAAAGHHGEAGAGEFTAHLAREVVITVPRLEAGGAEHRDAGLLELEALEAAQELEEDPHGALEVGLARSAPGEECLLGAFDMGEEGAALRRQALGHVHVPSISRCPGSYNAAPNSTTTRGITE